MPHTRDLGSFSFLSAYDPQVTELALALRDIVREEVPGVLEQTYKNHPAAVWFGFGPKMGDMFSYIAAASRHVNLGFCNGASLEDPNHSLEGAGKRMRHLKFRKYGDLERAFVRRFIRAAADGQRTGRSA
jgi:hypothetical protein